VINITLENTCCRGHKCCIPRVIKYQPRNKARNIYSIYLVENEETESEKTHASIKTLQTTIKKQKKHQAFQKHEPSH